ncbi:MAG: phage/plasmid primase, P4 family, partial [Planctomycetota bacterium]
AEQNGLVPRGSRDPDTGRLVLSARRTQPTAIAFVRQFAMPQGLRTLHSYADELFEWKGNRYVHLPDAAASQRLLPWLHRAVTYQKNRNGDFYLAPFPANPSTVDAALRSVHMHVHQDLDQRIPCWLDGRTSPAPSELVPCRNGTLHVPTRTLHVPDPRLFNTNALDFDYDPNAASPTRWLQFLNEVFGEDVQARNLLQEWLGYSLVADTSQQKILLIVGPPRSGKGTIGRVLHALVGEKNVVNPTVGGLSGPFGLQPLLDKSVAVISDARFSGPNVHVVTERLLTISGEDAVTIDRKHKECVTVRLQTRFVVLTNELPSLPDASAALARRFVTVQLQNSFYGREDQGLEQKLGAELPGILLWALDGWQRLRDRGRFEQPDSARKANEEIEDLASPARAFVRDCCELGAGLRVSQEALYDQFRVWCDQEGRSHIQPRSVFARELKAAFGLDARRDSKQHRFYDGIGLAPRGDA